MNPAMQVAGRDITAMPDFVGDSGTAYTFEIRPECFVQPGKYDRLSKFSEVIARLVNKNDARVGFSFRTAGGAEMYLCWWAEKDSAGAWSLGPLVFVDREQVIDFVAWQTELGEDTDNIPARKLATNLEMAINDLRAQFARTIAKPAAAEQAANQARLAAARIKTLAKIESKL